MKSVTSAAKKVSINGIVNVDKPKGKTSYGVVAWLKRLSGERHIGHAGTLDPLATGVLPICFGQSTKIIQFLMGSVKIYLTELKLGVVTDTYDCDGKIIAYGDVSNVTREQVEAALNSFQGSIEQIPPIYSALKYHGKRYYDLARMGVSIKPGTRIVEIFSARITKWLPPFVVIEVECGKGTYIRSLVHELGQVLGCGACVSNLRRLGYGPFLVSQAATVSEIETAFKGNFFTELLSPPDSALPDWQKVIVDEEQEFQIKHGSPLSLLEKLPTSSAYCRVYGTAGHFIAVLCFKSETGLWHPVAVFNT